MQTRWIVAPLIALALAGRMVAVDAQKPGPPPPDVPGPGHHHEGVVLVPDSSRERDEDRGQRAHTNHVVHLRNDDPQGPGHNGGKPAPPPSGPKGESPQSLIPYYVPGYPNTPGGSNLNPGAGVIVIVDAFDYPSALSDFNKFATQFGLPNEHSTNVLADTNTVFQVIYAAGAKPRSDCGWAQEEALDIEWAHAVAPQAKIILIEAKSSSFTDLLQAVDVANNLQANSSPQITNIQLSMSWGGSEFSSESLYDSHFSNPTIAYLAASGDSGGKTIYPSTSPFVIAAGGTSLQFTSGAITGEKGWSGSGGGKSPYESIPSYQTVVSGIVGTHRGTPDISFDADPATGVSVYDSTSCGGLQGWMVFGGTSVASPALAGILNLVTAATPGKLGNSVLPTIYATYGNSSSYPLDFHDVVGGKAGTFTAVTGWDFVTGIGSNKGLSGK